MDKYTNYINELGELLHLSEDKKEGKEKLIDEQSKTLSQVHADLESSSNKVMELKSKIKLLKNYKQELNKIKKVLFKELIETFIKFNAGALIAMFIISLVPEMVFSVPVFMVAEAVILMGLTIGYTQLYSDATKDIKKDYKNNNIKLLRDEIIDEYENQKKLTSQESSLKNEIALFENEVLELDEIIDKIKETISIISSSRTQAFNKLLEIEKINEEYNTMMKDDFRVDELTSNVLKLLKNGN